MVRQTEMLILSAHIPKMSLHYLYFCKVCVFMHFTVEFITENKLYQLGQGLELIKNKFNALQE